jgi:hypothetical protein
MSMRMSQDATDADFLRPAGAVSASENRGADRQTPAPERATVYEGNGDVSPAEAAACTIQGV